MNDRVKVEFLKAARQAGLEPRTVSAAPLRAAVFSIHAPPRPDAQKPAEPQKK